MRIKKRLKKLIDDRTNKLYLTRMDIDYSREKYKEVLSLNLNSLKKEMEDIETEMKLKKSWISEKSQKRKNTLNKRYGEVNGEIVAAMTARQRIKELKENEESFVSYIKFVKNYLRTKAWKL